MRLTAESTRVAFVCGHPIKHSRSPVIHRHWLSRYGIEGDYRAIDVAPGNVMTFLQSMRRNGFVGRHLAAVGDDILNSVGAYHYEGQGIQLFERIDGDYFSIVGLPLLALLHQLRELGAIDG